MDLTKEELAQEQLDQLKAALKKSNSVENTGAVTGTYSSEPATVTLSNSTGQYSNTVIGGGYTLNSSLGPNATPYYTVTGSNGTGVTAGINWGVGTGISNTAGPTWANTHMSGKINLNGDEADIVVNGVSLMEVLRDRLNVMIPNPELEKEWAELKELGDKYRAVEADLKEKAEIWKKLKG